MIDLKVLAAIAILLGSLAFGPKGDSSVPPPLPVPGNAAASTAGVN